MSSRLGAIMLIEDNCDHAELTTQILNDCGRPDCVRWFSDAESAIIYLLGDKDSDDSPPRPVPDLILLDINLPCLSGIEALQQIKGNPKTRRIPVVMLTSSRRTEEIFKSYEYGANSYVVKPMDFDLFREKMVRLNDYWTRTSEHPAPYAE